MTLWKRENCVGGSHWKAYKNEEEWNCRLDCCCCLLWTRRKCEFHIRNTISRCARVSLHLTGWHLSSFGMQLKRWSVEGKIYFNCLPSLFLPRWIEVEVSTNTFHFMETPIPMFMFQLGKSGAPLWHFLDAETSLLLTQNWMQPLVCVPQQPGSGFEVRRNGKILQRVNSRI